MIIDNQLKMLQKNHERNMLTLNQIGSRILPYFKEISMLKNYLKLMTFVMVLITFYEKIITSDDEQLNNNLNSNQLVVYQLNLRPSARYASMLYDANKKESQEEQTQSNNSSSHNVFTHAQDGRLLRERRGMDQLHLQDSANLSDEDSNSNNMMNSLVPTVHRHAPLKINNDEQARQLLADHVERSSIPIVASVSLLSVILEEGSNDSDAYTECWSTEVDTDLVDDIDKEAAVITLIRKSTSLSNVAVSEIHDLSDADFDITSSSSSSFYQHIPLNSEQNYSKTPYNSPQDSSPKNERNKDDDQA